MHTHMGWTNGSAANSTCCSCREQVRFSKNSHTLVMAVSRHPGYALAPVDAYVTQAHTYTEILKSLKKAQGYCHLFNIRVSPLDGSCVRTRDTFGTYFHNKCWFSSRQRSKICQIIKTMFSHCQQYLHLLAKSAQNASSNCN